MNGFGPSGSFSPFLVIVCFLKGRGDFDSSLTGAGMIEDRMIFPTEALFGEVEAKYFYAPFDVLFKSPDVALPICRR